MADNPFFSIIVPVYGVEKYLRECIESILNQTFSDFELILVDDGSKDSCPQICDEYKEKDNRIVVIHKTNEGLVSARKSGIKIARGEYCFAIDGDDYVDINLLSENYTIIQKYSPDIVCYGFYRKFENKCIKHLPKIKEGFYLKEDIIKHVFPILIQSDKAVYFDYPLAYKCLKKGLYQQAQMAVNPEIKIGEDSACAIPCMYNSNSIYVLSKSFYYYRVNNQSMTQENKGFNLNVPELIYDHLSLQIDKSKYDFNDQIDRKYIHDLNSVVLSYCFSNSNYIKTNTIIKKLLSEPLPKKKLAKNTFKSAKAFLMQWFLKNNFLFPIFAYAKIKKHF